MKKIIPFFASVGLITTLLTTSIFAQTGTYTTVKGDTMWEIAKKYNITISDLINANPQFKNPDVISPGNTVYVPLKEAIATDDSSIKDMEEQVVILINNERTTRGLQPLMLNWKIGGVARVKANDMRDYEYLGHVSPNYGTTYDLMDFFNMPSTDIGENVGVGYNSPKELVTAWMKSPTHCSNILNPKFKQIGVGYSTNGEVAYWSELFVSDDNVAMK